MLRFILGRAEGRFPYCNCFLYDGEIRVLVDAGCGLEELRELSDKLDGLDAILLSHAHPDHAGYAWWIRGKFGCEVWCHELDAPYLRSWDSLMKLYGVKSRDLRKVWMDYVPSWTGFRPLKADVILTDGEKVFGDYRVVHTPGHTPGHICLWNHKSGILMSFDIDLTNFPWYGNKYSSLMQFIESIRKICRLPAKIVYSSHRYPIKGNLRGCFMNYLAIIRAREEKILAFLSEWRSINEIMEQHIFYPSWNYLFFKFFEQVMIERHLGKLLLEGKIECRLMDGQLKFMRKI